MLKRIFLLLGTLAVAAAFSGCGDQGGSTHRKAVAAMKMVSFSNYSGPLLGAVDVEINLPTGVTVPGISGTEPAQFSGTGAPVTLVGNWGGTGTMVGGSYLPANGTDPAKFKFEVVNPQGFTPGQEIDVQLDVGAGVAPNPADFSIPYLGLVYKDGSYQTVVIPMVYNQDYTVSFE
ncbi:hypothetical protein [Geomesophilobacter sediminis]|uniref:Lipoprotein n=1 Tax=Geomesophilobacter sediminis TaxID=2798584 RepID=A0A8J7JLJ5_9BACT|nr:hypothetical protein [Geomesophilobacter sediminis]MBJ6724955.1 hypothetical protein [Geomesophilobacter sediminis]